MKNTYWNRNGKHQATYNKLWDELVPPTGPAKTKEGELLRAMSRLYKRWYNDGDKIEPMLEEPVIDSSALNAWNYIYSYEDERCEIDWQNLALEIMHSGTDEEYEKCLEEAADTVIEYVNSVSGTPNDTDFTSREYKTLSPFFDTDEEEEEW